MSADGIDFVDANAHKSVSFRKYLELLKSSGIYIGQVAVIGDAENDEEVIKLILESGGIAGFVGIDNKLEERLIQVSNGNLIIPSQKGPLGTAEVINQILKK